MGGFWNEVLESKFGFQKFRFPNLRQEPFLVSGGPVRSGFKI